MTVPTSIHQKKFQDKLFTLEVSHAAKQTQMKMIFNDPRILTSELPATYPVLKEYLPSIFLCKCFNQSGLPFSEEVKDTEVAHLFEHILLEYLCKLKQNTGAKNISFKGETTWNWTQDKRGIFYITINAGFGDTYSFEQACRQSMDLFRLILRGSKVLH